MSEDRAEQEVIQSACPRVVEHELQRAWESDAGLAGATRKEMHHWLEDVAKHHPIQQGRGQDAEETEDEQQRPNIREGHVLTRCVWQPNAN